MKLDQVDMIDEDFFVHGEPHAAWRVLRAEAPVHWNPGHNVWSTQIKRELEHLGFWNVTKYEDIFTISRDPATFISSQGISLGAELPEDMAELQQQYDSSGRMLIVADPPRHTKLRMLVNKGFTPRVISKLEPHIREITHEILDAVTPRGECDFVVDVSARLPLAVICELMGIPHDDWQYMFDFTNRAIGGQDPEYQVEGEDIMSLQMQAFTYFMQRIEVARSQGREDLLTRLVQSEIDGEKLDDFDIVLFCLLLIIAGNETTRNATTGGMLALIEHPAQRARLLADRSLLPKAIEEILRWTSPVMHMTRVATRDFDLRGTRIRKGDRVAMWYTSANRDEDAFPDPYRFDVGREPNEHLAFGVGEHFCLGANLARLELTVMFEELLERLPDVELAGSPERLRSNFIGGIKHMPVRWPKA
jgi:cytochrome P450